MRTKHTLATLLLALAGACASDPAPNVGDFFGGSGSRETRPVPVDDGLVFVTDGAREPRLVALDLSGAEPRVASHDLPAEVAVTRARPGRALAEMVVLTRGREAYDEGTRRVPAERSELVLIGRDGIKVRRPLLGRYGQLALSDDGQFAIAHAPIGIGAQNAVELIDLDQVERDPLAATGSTPVLFSLNGLAPTRFVFSPAGFSPRLVAVPFADSVQLLNVERPGVGVTSIPIKAATDPRSLRPGKVLFAESRIFVQAEGSSDVFSIQLLPADNVHGFVPSFSLLTASAPVSDIALVGQGPELRLLAVAQSLELFDPARGRAIRLDGVSGFSAVHPFSGRTPADAQVASRALVYTPGQSRVGFLDLAGETTWEGRRVELLELGASLTAIVPLATRTLALALHNDRRLSVIDLESRTVGPISLDAPLASYLLDESAPGPRLWILTQVGTLAAIDIDHGKLVTSEVPLEVEVDSGPSDATPATLSNGQLVLVPSATRRRLAVFHRSTTGRVTLLDAANPTRESARELAGFFLADLLD